MCASTDQPAAITGVKIHADAIVAIGNIYLTLDGNYPDGSGGYIPAGVLACCTATSAETWVIIAPGAGWEVTDASNGARYRYGTTTGGWLPLYVSALAAGGTQAATVTADAAASSLAVDLHIDFPLQLSGDLTLTATRVVVEGQGYIDRGIHALTIQGELTGSECKQLLIHGSGTLLIQGGSRLYGAWFTGPYGDSGTDYAPGLQDAVTIVMRAASSATPGGGGTGPRELDLRGGTSSAYGIYLNSTLTLPDNAAYGAIFAHGQSLYMNTDNTPIFKCTAANSGTKESINWSILGDRWTEYRWKNAQPAANTSARVLITDASAANLVGHRSFTLKGGLLINANGLIANVGTAGHFDGWWDSRIEDFVVIGATGIVIKHQPATGGAERQFYRNILCTGPAAPTAPVFQIYNVGGLEIDQWSVDGWGQGASFATSRLCYINSCQNFSIRNGHIEACQFDSSVGEIFYVYSSTGEIAGLQLATNEVNASGALSLATVGGLSTNSHVTMDNISATGTTLDSGATATLLNVPNAGYGNEVKLGRNIKMDGAWIDFKSSLTANAQQIVQDGEILIPFYAAGLSGSPVIKEMALAGGSTMGMNAYRPLKFVGLTFQLSGALSGTSIFLKVQSGSTQITYAYIYPAAGTQGILKWNWPDNQAGLIFAPNAPLQIFVQPVAVSTAVDLSVGLIVK